MKVVATAALCAGLIALPTLSVSAECKGYNARKSAAPIKIHEVKDGAVTIVSESTGIGARTSPADADESANWQTCHGLTVVAADKSQTYTGRCYEVGASGAIIVYKYDGENGNGSWEIVEATGEYSDRVGSRGTWTYSRAYPDGTTILDWEGECKGM